ncbi:MAG: DUF4139 domain-containing protein, partial [Myxococcales bacterium]|nr:DUF4139 domain-containing protein [Myxococcales bacterium]
ALFADEHKLSEELARVVKRRAAMAEALARTQGDRPPEAMSLRKTAAFDLLRSQDGPFDIEVSYFVPAALWAPSYALRIDAKTSRAVIELRAAICQATGEDWSGVAVSFSTAEAMRFHELEELTSLRIGRAQAPRRKSFRALDDPRELFADFDSAFASARAAVEVSVAAEDALDEVTASGYGAFPPSAGDSLREEGTMERPRMQTMAGALPMPASFAPPPQAMAMAPPMAAPGMAFQPMPAARSRRASLEADVLPPRKGGLGLFGGGGRAGAPPVDDFEEPSEPEIELDGRLFAFESLRMPPPEAKKGRLALATPMEAYLEASRSLSRVRAPAIAGALEALGRARDRLLATDPPRRHVLPHAESGFHHVLMGEHRVDVPSDAAFHTLPVSRGEAPLAIRHVAVPRETSDVFRVATFQNPFAVPLLRGPCDVYVDDDFLLTVELPTVLASAEARVGLGVDQAIKLARNTHFSEQTQGLMGGALLLKHRIDIEVVSHLTLSASLEIRERVPSAHEKDEDIRIEVGEVSPPW